MINDASLVMIPSGYKDGKLYSVKPTDGSGDFTFSRGSNLAATRVNSDGLIEKGRENLLLQSNQFDTTWTLNNASVSGGQAGYDGTNDAWRLSGLSGTAEKRLRQNPLVSGVHTISVYAKAGTVDFLWLRGVTNSANIRTFFNLSNGTIGSDNAIASTIQDVGNGWYRCTSTINQQSGFEFYIGVTDSDGSASTSTTGNIYIQDAQLEAGLVATDYIETTTTTAQAGILEDMPRLNYGTCPSLLLEPQRTNVITQSEYLDSWTKTSAGTGSNPVLDFGYQSPEGLNNAYKVTFDKGAGTTTSDLSVLFTSFTSITNTASFYVKADSATRLMVRNSTNWEIYDITTEWTRIEKTDTGGSIQIGLREGYGVSDVPNSSTVYIYGAMVEAGSYPTSYIPTYGASVTRGADSCSKTGISSLIGQTEGTIFVEFDLTEGYSNNQMIVTLSDNTSNNYILVQRYLGAIGCRIDTSGTKQVDSYPSLTSSGKHKIALAYALNDIKLYLDGNAIITDTSANIPLTSKINIGSYFNETLQLGDGLKQLILFKTRLSNDELTSLTS